MEGEAAVQAVHGPAIDEAKKKRVRRLAEVERRR